MARRSDHTREELRDLALRAGREIIREGGVSTLSARRVARRIGYTVGTIYQIFRSMDDLVEQVNAETLQALYAHCRTVDDATSPSERLESLADRFNEYVRQEQKLWEAVMLHRFASDYERSNDYTQKVEQLLGLIADAIDPFYDDGDRARQMSEARVLWAGLYGIYALDAANRLGRRQTVKSSVATLVEMFVQAKRRVG